MPRYLQDAISTSIGHAHPLMGYQLDANKDLDNAWPYYQPNQGRYSFIDPAGEATPDGVILFQRDGFDSLGASLALHHRYEDVESITWSFGDDSDDEVGLSTFARHVYAEADDYTVGAELVSTAEGTKNYSVTLSIIASTGVVTQGEIIGIDNAESV